MSDHLTVEEFASDFLDEQATEKAWAKALQAQSFLATAVNPKSLIGFYETDVNTHPRRAPKGRFGREEPVRSDDPADVKFYNAARERKSAFVTSIEEAYHQYRGKIPMEFWQTMSPVDLRSFGDGTFDGLADFLEDAQFHEGVELEKREEIRDEFFRRIKAQQNRNSFLQDWGRNPSFISRDDIMRNVTLELRGRADELVPDEIAEFMESERLILQAFRDGVEIPDSSKLAELERFGIENEDRFFLSNGDVLSPKDHIRYFEQEMAFLDAANIADITAITDEKFEELLKTREEFLRLELRQNPQHLNQILTPGRGIGGFEGSLQAFGTIMEKGFHYGGMIAEAGYTAFTSGPVHGFAILASEVVNFFKDNSEEHMEQTLAAADASTGLPDPELMARGLNIEVSRAWEIMLEESPENHNTYMEMANGDELMAFGFFGADLQGQISPDDQQRYITDLGLQEDERFEHLRDSDFTVGDTALNWLAIWGRNVPGRLSTMFAVILTDDDMQAQAIHNGVGGLINTFQEIAEISEAGGHTPSRVLGLDGTAMGLMIDLGGGIAFDPTIWLFGPRLMGRGTAPATARAASALKKSRWTRQIGDDVWMSMQSPSRGAETVYQMLDGIDDVFVGQILNEVRWQPQVFSKRPWALKKGHKAVELRVDFLDDIIDDSLRKGDDLSGLADDMIKNGVPEDGIIVIEISRADRSMRIVEGSKRVMAGQADDTITHLPTTIRIVDDTAIGAVKVIPGVSSKAVARMESIVKTIEAKGGANIDIAAQLKGTVTVRRTRSPVGDAGTQTLKNGDTASIKFIDEGDNQLWWAEAADGEILGVIQVGDDLSGLATMPTHTKNGVFSSIMDAAQGMNVELILKFELTAVSPEAAIAIKAYAARQLQKAVPVARRAGKQVDDVLREGESLGKPFEKPGKGTVSQQRPDAIFPQRVLAGEDITADGIKEILGMAIDNGWVPRGAQYTAVARGAGVRLRKLARGNVPGRWIERFLTPMFVGKRFELAGPHAIGKIRDTLYRMFGEDSAVLNVQLEKLLNWQRKFSVRSEEAARRLTEMIPREQRLALMHDKVGELYAVADGAKLGKAGIWTGLDDVAKEAAKKEWFAARRALIKEDAAVQAKYAEIHAETSGIGATDELNQIMIEVWEEYFDLYVATNPAWKGTAMYLENGKPNWQVLGKGGASPPKTAAEIEFAAKEAAQVFPESVAAAADQMGIEAETLAQKLMHSQNATLAFEAPVSPLDLLMAREWGGALYTRATHVKFVAGVRETVMAAHRLWTIDKVFTIATAATVSFDELLRLFHIGGPRAMARWTADRGVAFEARVRALKHGEGFKKRPGEKFVSDPKRERMEALRNMPNLLKQAERQTLEQHGLGWVDIVPGSKGYDDAARQWAGGLLQDTGFRAMLRGRNEFRKWFNGPDGERLRQSTVVGLQEGKPSTLFIESADEFFDGWTSLFDDVILAPAKKSGKFAEVKAAWLKGADEIELHPGVPHDLPNVVYENMGPVRGTRRDMGSKANIAEFQEAFFERLFMNPVNYRRGFLAEMVRTQERSRLVSLFESQGRRIVSDTEIEALLGIQGLAGAQRTGLRAAVQDMSLRAGYIPESYIDDLVEQAVLKEIENVLYTFDSSSRLGSQARAVFPFGKPWADMAAFWGREVVRRPVLRGWINDSNFMGLRSMNDAGVLAFPLVPNRTSALISRLAHTDFTIDKGLIGGEGEGILHEGGLIPGSTSTDFSPLFFLPTGGENAFSYLLPGTGILPLWGIDYFMAGRFDPIEEPEEYNQLRANISQIIPSARFSQGGNISRVLGGGSAARLGGMAVDISGMFGHDSYFNITSQMGDITRELDRTRGISALMADPEEMKKLHAATSPEEADQLIQDLAIRADQRASQSHLAESAVRWMVPASTRLSNDLAEIQDVWVQAGNLESLSHVLKGRDPEEMNPEDLRTLAADVRTAYFKLEPWQRDVAITLQESIATNVIGSFEWTPNAKNLNLPGVQEAYRTGGSKTELALHETYVKQGLVRPRQPVVRGRIIIGTQDAARKSVAKQLYTEQIDQVNEILWEEILLGFPEIITTLESVVDSDFGRERDLRTVKEVWFNWRSVEVDFELWTAEQESIEPVRGISGKKEDITEFDLLRGVVTILEDLKPWGNTFPGLEEENVTDTFNNFVIPAISPKSRELADALGIELEVGMTGEELFKAVQQIVVQRDSYLWDVARPDYERYIQNRTNRTGINMMHEAAQSDLNSPDFQDHIKNFIFIDGLMSERYDEERFVPLQDQYKMRDLFLFLLNGSKEKKPYFRNEEGGLTAQKTDWEGIWESQFERKYGPLDWIPPEPPSPFDENGDVRGGVLMPSIRYVIDGDSLFVQQHPGSKVLNGIRLLGVDAPEMGGPDPEGGAEHKKTLQEALLQGLENGDTIYFVTDDRFGKTDKYGRMLAWLWIGDTPFYNVEDLLPHRDPSGGE